MPTADNLQAQNIIIPQALPIIKINSSIADKLFHSPSSVPKPKRATSFQERILLSTKKPPIGKVNK